jgi:hypothetical protein
VVIRGEASKLLSGDFAMKHEGILPWFNRAKMMINYMTGSNQFRPPNKPHFKYVLFFSYDLHLHGMPTSRLPEMRGRSSQVVAPLRPGAWLMACRKSHNLLVHFF